MCDGDRKNIKIYDAEYTWLGLMARFESTEHEEQTKYFEENKDDVLQSGRINIDKSLQRMKDLHSYLEQNC